MRKKHFSLERMFVGLCVLLLMLPLCMLALFLVYLLVQAWPRLSFDFLINYPSRHAHVAGILPALVGSFYLLILTAFLAIPVGVSAAIYLEEYAQKNALTSLIELNISNLAGVPSIIYGLLGLEIFVRILAFGRSVLAGACTLSLLLLPMVIMASREALRNVPRAMREACYALGAGPFHTIFHVVLKMALPHILTGVILSMARAIGETAPLITIGALTYVAFLPDSVFSSFTALPIQIFNWTSRPQVEFHQNAAAGILVLLVLMLLFNGTAMWIRHRLQKRF